MYERSFMREKKASTKDGKSIEDGTTTGHCLVVYTHNGKRGLKRYSIHMEPKKIH
jgi:hypothetical protein